MLVLLIFILIILSFSILYFLLNVIKKLDIFIDLIYSKFDIDFDYWGSDKNV